MNILVALLLLASFLGGLVILVRGWRGRVIPGRIACRKCRYELKGLEQREQCPECGADISKTRAVAPARSARLPRLIAAGLVPMMITLGTTGVWTYGWATDVDWWQYKPYWWLVMNLDDNDPFVVEDARLYLFDRWQSGNLSDAQVNDLRRIVLGKLRDRQKPVPIDWQQFITDEHFDGLIDKASWQLFAERTLEWRIRARKRVRIGDPVPIELTCEWSDYATEFEGTVRVKKLTIGNRSIAIPPELVESRDTPFTSLDALVMISDDQLPPEVGSQTMQITLEVTVTDIEKPNEILTTLVKTADAQLELINESSVKFVRDTTLRDEMIKAIQIEEVEVRRWDDLPKFLKLMAESRLQIEPELRAEFESAWWMCVPSFVENPPIAVFASISLKTGSRKDLISTVACQANDVRRTGEGFVFLSVPVEPLPGVTHVDLLLQPDAETAAKTLKYDSIWGDSIVIRDVPLRIVGPETERKESP